MPTIDTTITSIFRALGDYVVQCANVEREQIVKTPVDNEPLPFGAVVMTLLHSRNMDTHATRYDSEAETASVARSVNARVQLDFYGADAHERSQIIETLWRTEYTVETLGILTPLFVNSRMRDVYVNDSERYEDRWILDLALQYNPVVKHHQDFINEIDLTIKPVTNEVS